MAADLVVAIAQAVGKQPALRIQQQPRRFDGAARHDHDVGELFLPAAVGIDVGHAARAAAIVGEDPGGRALGAQFAVAGGQGDGNDGVLRAVLGVHFAGEAAAPAAAHARAAAVVGNAVARHGQMKGMQAETFCRRLQDAEFAIGRQRRHGQIALARSFERRARIIAGDADLVFGLVVKRLEIVIGDGPVFERTALGRAVGGAHAEILRHVAPGLRAVTQSSAAHARGVVVVCALAGQDDVRLRPFASTHTRGLPSSSGPKAFPRTRGALIAQIVFAAVMGGVPLAALEHHHAESGGGQLLGDDASRGAGADDDRIHALHRFDPAVRSYCARPRSGGSSSPSMRQLTASRLPPWRGDP